MDTAAPTSAVADEQTTVDREGGTATDEPLQQGADKSPADCHRLQHDSSILAVAITNKHIYAGTGAGEILVSCGFEAACWLRRARLIVLQVFALSTYERVYAVKGHNGSVLALNLSEDETLLCSSAGDRIVNVGCPTIALFQPRQILK